MPRNNSKQSPGVGPCGPLVSRLRGKDADVVAVVAIVFVRSNARALV